MQPSFASAGSAAKVTRHALSAICIAGLVGSAAAAHAHIGPPRAVGVTVAADNPAHVLFRTTFGSVMTRDAGVTFEWFCGDGVGYEANFELPHGAIFSDGSMAIGTFNGLRMSNDGCDWQDITGPASGSYFRQLIQGNDAAHAIGLRTNGLGNFMFEVDLWGSDNDGKLWERVGAKPPADFLAYGVGVAPSDANRIYLAGQDGAENARQEVVMRSDDRGASWQRLPLPSNDPNALTTIAAIDPTDADIVYVASTIYGETPSFRLQRSVDGNTFEEVANWPARVSSVALSPAGDRLAIGAEDTGLWLAPIVSSDGPLDFESGVLTTVHCLTWLEQGLYACASQDDDGFVVGLSHDDGATFEPFMHRDDPCLLACDSDTSVGEVCAERWEAEKVELGVSGCGDGSSGGGSGGGGGAGGNNEPPTASGSCSCNHGPRKDSNRWLWLLPWLTTAGAWRRLRRQP